MQRTLKDSYRKVRLFAKQIIGKEPVVARDVMLPLESHGSEYGGWCIPKNSLTRKSVVVDAGLGEDVSFSTSLIERYGVTVHGFDPTPRAIAYVENFQQPGLLLYKFGIGAESIKTTFFLPNDARNVSGSYFTVDHVGRDAVDVDLLNCDDLMRKIGAERIDLLKLDIEGAEYDVFASDSFRHCAPRIAMICVEFHHRWNTFGPQATLRAVKALRSQGFQCIWRSPTTNEEFTFVRAGG